jgi:UDP-N-acetyl-D-mannosaminuronate dehydrogenase
MLESTTYPGTTEGVLRPRLETQDLMAGRDFFLAFSPERIDPANRTHELGQIPKVVGGVSPARLELVVAWDVVLILTAHDGCDWKRVVREGALVIDTRNATDELGPALNVIRL